jgi:hypothetical protein
VLSGPGQIEDSLCALLFDLGIKDAGVFVHRVPVDDGPQALLLQDDHIPLLFSDLVDGTGFLDVPLECASAYEMAVSFDLPAISGVRQCHDNGRQIIRRRIAVSDEKHLQWSGALFLRTEWGCQQQDDKELCGV